ncbi:hypothetical protein IEQ34_020474 [Dendrobium chrysotoxum]|uniref:Uncharacterized protein n=1 Tax=Dendrobium chrysotoxum TaxID=161865 RepID=A0AAV7G263_DENCH|nr:hypothetical protein IEQ34_020474 [Dendrobium chrysotoxum]
MKSRIANPEEIEPYRRLCERLIEPPIALRLALVEESSGRLPETSRNRNFESDHSESGSSPEKLFRLNVIDSSTDKPEKIFDLRNPLRKLLPNFRCRKFLRLLKLSGNAPNSELKLRSSVKREETFPSSGGMEPVKLLLARIKVSNFDKSPISGSTTPVIKLEERSRSRMASDGGRRLPNQSGIEPRSVNPVALKEANRGSDDQVESAGARRGLATPLARRCRSQHQPMRSTGRPAAASRARANPTWRGGCRAPQDPLRSSGFYRRRWGVIRRR